MSGAVQGRRVQVRWSVGDGQIIQTAVKNDRSASSSRVCVCVCVCVNFFNSWKNGLERSIYSVNAR